MQWTMGRGKFGQAEDCFDACWQEFSDFLRDCQRIVFDPSNKDHWWWMAPFVLHQGADHRRIDDIDHMAGWIGLDVDLGNLSINDLRVKISGRWLAYTTASSAAGASRWRIIIGLSRPYSVAEYIRIWHWYASVLQLDTQTKNPNRILYLPANWVGADNQWWMQDARPANVDTILSMMPATDVQVPRAAPVEALRAAPLGIAIITPYMIAAAQSAPQGGRLYRLLCQSAKRFRLNGWNLVAADLADAGMQATLLFSPDKKRDGLVREAQRAIDWAAQFPVPTPFERMRERILWERNRR